MARSSHRGLMTPTTRTGSKPALISRITRLELHYTVQWPLNVIVSDDQIRIYQQLFPILLQVGSSFSSERPKKDCRNTRIESACMPAAVHMLRVRTNGKQSMSTST